MSATMACSDRGSVIVGMTLVSEAQYAPDKWPMRIDSQKVRVIDPLINLILVTADDAEIERRVIFQAALDVEQTIVLEGNRAEVVEDAYLWRGVIIEVVTDGGRELANLDF